MKTHELLLPSCFIKTEMRKREGDGDELQYRVVSTVVVIKNK
jgi:hypothetical protein